MAVNYGAAFAGIGSGLKNMITAVPQAQAQMQNAAYKGAQQRDLDWTHNNKVAQQEAMGRLLASQNYNNDLKEIMMRGDMSDGQKISALLGAIRQGSSTVPYLDSASAMQQMNSGATPQGVVNAYNSIAGQASPDGLIAPAPENSPTPQIDRQAIQQRLANNAKTIADLSSLDAMIRGHNQFGNADQYGYQANHLIGGGNVIDPTRAEEKHALNQATLAQKQASTANTQSIMARRAATPIRGVGRPRSHRRGRKSSSSGGNGLFDVMNGVSKFVDKNRKADARDKRNMKYVGGTGGSARDED